MSSESHWLPQLPQLLRSVLSDLQLPLQQVCPEPQALPQPPQFASSLLVATQAPPQHTWPLLQLLSLVQTQRPAWQLKLLGQAWPQPLQCWALVWRLVSQPLAALPSQLPKPPLQAVSWQLPVLQLAVPLARLHATLQPAQWVLLLSCVSQPAVLLQLPQPLWQV